MRASSDNPARRTVPMLHPRKLTALMKKSVIYILILACLLLASCGSTMPADPGTSSVVQMTTDSTGGASASAKMMRWAFYSYEDLLLFCETGAKDISLYQKPPQGDVFPPFKMQEKCLLDYKKMFPSLAENDVGITYVEIVDDHTFGIAGVSSVAQTPFSIRVQFQGERTGSTVDSLIESGTFDSFEEIVQGDYYSQSWENAARDTSILYIFATQASTLTYTVFNNRVSGMTLFYGQYTISVGPRFSSNNAFFTDEALRSLSCLFQSGEERDKAVLRIQNYLDSLE